MGIYEIPLTTMNVLPSSNGVSVLTIVKFVLFITLFLFGIFSAFILNNFALVLLSGVLIISIALIVYTVKFNPRLNEEGFLERDNWRGFRLYLKTAEQYRLQKLTPDLFEKFLPYAMVFGIEKEWAKAFEALHLTPSQWYGTQGYPAVATGVATIQSFSPSAFSTSFPTSFSSSFSSSSGGGSSGGGFAGGGGGGGGGSAR